MWGQAESLAHKRCQIDAMTHHPFHDLAPLPLLTGV